MNKYLFLSLLLAILVLILLITKRYKRNGLSLLRGENLRTSETITSLNGLYSLQILSRKSVSNSDINILCVVNKDNKILWEVVPENGLTGNKSDLNENIPETALGSSASHDFNIGSSIKLVRIIDTSTGLYNVYIQGDDSTSKRIKIAENQADFNHTLFIDDDGILKLTASTGIISLSEPLLYKLSMSGPGLNCGIGGGGNNTITGWRIPGEVMTKFPKYRRMADLVYSNLTYPKNGIFTNWIIRKAVAKNVVKFGRAWGKTGTSCSLWLNTASDGQAIFGTSINFGFGDGTQPSQDVSCDFSYVVAYTNNLVTYVGDDAGSNATDSVVVYRACVDADWAVTDSRSTQYGILKNLTIFQQDLRLASSTLSLNNTTDLNVFNNWTSMLKSCKIIGKLDDSTVVTDNYGALKLNKSVFNVNIGDSLIFIHSSQVPLIRLKSVNETYTYKIFYYDLYGKFNSGFYYCRITPSNSGVTLPLYKSAITPLTNKYVVYQRNTAANDVRRKVFNISDPNFHLGQFFFWDNYFVSQSDIANGITSQQFRLNIKVEGGSLNTDYADSTTWDNTYILDRILRNNYINPLYINKITFIQESFNKLNMIIQYCYWNEAVQEISTTTPINPGIEYNIGPAGVNTSIPSTNRLQSFTPNIPANSYITNITWGQRLINSIKYKNFQTGAVNTITNSNLGFLLTDGARDLTNNTDENFGLVGIYTLTSTTKSWYCVNGVLTIYRDVRVPFELDNPQFYRIFINTVGQDNSYEQTVFGVQSNRALSYYGNIMVNPTTSKEELVPATKVTEFNFKNNSLPRITAGYGAGITNIPWFVDYYFLQFNPSYLGYLSDFSIYGSNDGSFGWSGVGNYSTKIIRPILSQFYNPAYTLDMAAFKAGKTITYRLNSNKVCRSNNNNSEFNLLVDPFNKYPDPYTTVSPSECKKLCDSRPDCSGFQMWRDPGYTDANNIMATDQCRLFKDRKITPVDFAGAVCFVKNP